MSIYICFLSKPFRMISIFLSFLINIVFRLKKEGQLFSIIQTRLALTLNIQQNNRRFNINEQLLGIPFLSSLPKPLFMQKIMLRRMLMCILKILIFIFNKDRLNIHKGQVNKVWISRGKAFIPSLLSAFINDGLLI